MRNGVTLTLGGVYVGGTTALGAHANNISVPAAGAGQAVLGGTVTGGLLTKYGPGYLLLAGSANSFANLVINGDTPANQTSLISVGVTTFGSPVKDCAGVLGGPTVSDACGTCGGTVKDSTKCIGATSSAASSAPSAPRSHQSQSGSVAAGVAGGILYLIVIAMVYYYSNQKRKSAANNSVKAAGPHL
jgi:hypothetical protein